MNIKQALEICNRIEAAIDDFRQTYEATKNAPGAIGWKLSDSAEEFAHNSGVTGDRAVIEVLEAGKVLPL